MISAFYQIRFFRSDFFYLGNRLVYVTRLRIIKQQRTNQKPFRAQAMLIFVGFEEKLNHIKGRLIVIIETKAKAMRNSEIASERPH